MTAARGDQIADGYLARLEIELTDLPSTQRERTVAEVRDRIAQARAAMVDETETDVFRLLDEIGKPGAVAAQARAGLPAAPSSGWLEALAIVGLSLVWPVGIALIRFSRVWSKRQKLIGALVPPGGYAALLAVLWILPRNPVDLGPSCVYGENCPPEWVTSVLGTVLSAVLTGAFWLWPAMPIASGVYLAVKAWPSTGRSVPRRLALVLAIGAGPVAAVLVYSSALIPATTGHSQPSAGGQPQPTASASPELSGLPRFPNRTQSQFETALGIDGFSCAGDQIPGGEWVTFCTGGAGSASAIGPDQRTIILVSTNDVGRDEASQLFKQVVRAACPPADAARIASWIPGHLTPGDQTDIDGYHVAVGGLVISGIAESVSLSLSRSAP